MPEEYLPIPRLLHIEKSTLHPAERAEEFYRQRISSPSAFVTNIQLDGHHKLFVTVFAKIAKLQEKIYLQEAKANTIWGMLPEVAQTAYLRGLLVNELMSTNQMEGVRSTRKEISEALADTSVPNSSKRFGEFAKLYAGLSERSTTAVLPTTLREIRNIYDKATDGEISRNDLPDGELFRAKEVFIQNPTTGKTIHKGLLPESNIQVQLTRMLELMRSEDVPKLLRAIICHYVFEYVHPFYDGNGRTGRYLLALQLRDCLSIPTAISVSPVIAENKNQYYKAFEDAENPLNCSDISLFTYKIMSFISDAQDTLLGDLEEKQQVIESARKKLDQFDKENSLGQSESSILFILIQESLFDSSLSGVTRKILMSRLNVRWRKINVLLDNLEALDLVEGKGERNRRYSLTTRAGFMFL